MAATRVPRVSHFFRKHGYWLDRKAAIPSWGAVRSWSGLAFSVSTSDGWNVPSRGRGEW